jgi:hypothetical protein
MPAVHVRRNLSLIDSGTLSAELPPRHLSPDSCNDMARENGESYKTNAASSAMRRGSRPRGQPQDQILILILSLVWPSSLVKL